MSKRRRFKQQLPLQDRLSTWANEVRERANQLSPGPERDILLMKAEQADTASHLNEWLNSPGLGAALVKDMQVDRAIAASLKQ